MDMDQLKFISRVASEQNRTADETAVLPEIGTFNP